MGAMTGVRFMSGAFVQSQDDFPEYNVNQRRGVWRTNGPAAGAIYRRVWM